MKGGYVRIGGANEWFALDFFQYIGCEVLIVHRACPIVQVGRNVALRVRAAKIFHFGLPAIGLTIKSSDPTPPILCEITGICLFQ